MGQGQAGPCKDGMKLAEEWEDCISSASVSNENTIESSLLHWPPWVAMYRFQILFVFV